MKGWVTWTGVVGLILLAVVDGVNGDIEAAVAKISTAIGMVGIGRKVEKGKTAAS
jgi:hypothetical protein